MLLTSDRVMVLASESALCCLVWDLLTNLEKSGYCERVESSRLRPRPCLSVEVEVGCRGGGGRV